MNETPRCSVMSAGNGIANVPAASFLAFALAATIPLHGWPLSALDSLRFFWLANCVVLAWCAVALLRMPTRTGRGTIAAIGPPECVWAYVIVSLLSVATADDLVRAGTSAVKTALFFLGTYTLVTASCRQQGTAHRMAGILAVGVSVCVLYAWIQRFAGAEPVSFFESPLKFGSFLAMAVPAGAIYLARSRRTGAHVGAGVLLMAALFVCASSWAVLGILVGCFVGGVCHPVTRKRAAWAVPAAMVLVTGVAWAGYHPGLASDAHWIEEDGRGRDLKQRYIEWQAQVNLLSDRAAVGTGTGCLNDQRSFYYGRLPKNNTIAPFDQNGWLAAASETSLLGLASMCWIFGHFGYVALRRLSSPIAHAAFTALAGIAIAQVASSIFYNGILVLFVMCLALIAHAPSHEDTSP